MKQYHCVIIGDRFALKIMDSELLYSDGNWRARILELRALLDELRPQLIEAETTLADRLAAISAFEYQVRARLEALSRRLDALQREIDELRARLRHYQEDWFDSDDFPMGNRAGRDTWHFDNDAGAAASGGYRYHVASTAPARPLEADQADALRTLYRRLARRFHPDLALDESDRTYRTDLMMAINAAYSAGDLEALERLALEPDSTPREPGTDRQLAESLEREVNRCRRRLAEIGRELQRLERHDSARLMQRAEEAAKRGRDLLNELATDLRRRISEKMVEREVLQNQLDEVEREGVELTATDLADLVFDLGLEQAGDDLFTSSRDWRPRDRRRWMGDDSVEEDEDILDDSD